MGTEEGKYIFMAKFGKREILAQPTQLLTSCASLAKLTNFSKLQITHMQKGYKNIFDMWFFQKTLSTGPGT